MSNPMKPHPEPKKDGKWWVIISQERRYGETSTRSGRSKDSEIDPFLFHNLGTFGNVVSYSRATLYAGFVIHMHFAQDFLLVQHLTLELLHFCTQRNHFIFHFGDRHCTCLHPTPELSVMQLTYSKVLKLRIEHKDFSFFISTLNPVSSLSGMYARNDNLLTLKLNCKFDYQTEPTLVPQ